MPEEKLTVGNVEILAIDDGGVDFPLPLTDLFPSVPPEAWAQYQERYPEVFAGPTTWRNHWGSYLLRSEGRNILIDTGVGSGSTNPGMINNLNGGVDGKLLTELQSIGVGLEDVDTVFFTHLHPDHLGYNLSEAGSSPKAMFPAARYVVNQADWDTFAKPEVQELFPFSFWEETIGPLERLGVLDLLSGEQALTSEIVAIPTPGHTPGHMSLRISSAGEQAIILGDVAVHPAQITEDDWYFAFEMDQPQAIRTRREFLDQLAQEGTTVAACHFPAPGFGKIVRIEGRRYWQGF